MFKRLCIWCHSPGDEADEWLWIIGISMIACGILFMIALTVGAVYKGITDQSLDPTIFIMLLSTVLASTFVPAILAIIGKVAGEWIKFATNGKLCPWDNYINSLSAYIAKESGSDDASKSTVVFAMLGAMCAIMLAIGLTITLLWCIPMVALTAGAAVGLTLLSRKSFQLGDKVVEHIKDPDAHKNVDNS